MPAARWHAARDLAMAVASRMTPPPVASTSSGPDDFDHPPGHRGVRTLPTMTPVVRPESIRIRGVTHTLSPTPTCGCFAPVLHLKLLLSIPQKERGVRGRLDVGGLEALLAQTPDSSRWFVQSRTPQKNCPSFPVVTQTHLSSSGPLNFCNRNGLCQIPRSGQKCATSLMPTFIARVG
eukprot:jgi/Bigna1/67116/fgenesh1_pg.3_\